jgi:hypothetical protein
MKDNRWANARFREHLHAVDRCSFLGETGQAFPFRRPQVTDPSEPENAMHTIFPLTARPNHNFLPLCVQAVGPRPVSYSGP